MAKPFYSMEEVATLLQKSQEQITAMVRAGSLREFRDSGKIFFKAEDVDRLRGVPKSSSDTGEITLETVEDASAKTPEEPLPSLVDTSGGTSIIGLADIEEEPKPPPSRAAKPATPTPSPSPAAKKPDKKSDTKIPKVGIGVFDEDELELDSDPMAKTHVSSGPAAAADQMSLKEGSGSGSGLLDLTREADDTSLGAELLDEIYPGEEEGAPAAPAPVAKAAPAPAKKPAAPAPTPAKRTPKERAADDAAETPDRAEEAVVATAPAARAPVAGGDPMEGFFGGWLVGALVLLLVGLPIAAALVPHDAFVPDFALYLADRFWIFLAGAVGVVGLAVLVGWLIGRGGTARRA